MTSHARTIASVPPGPPAETARQRAEAALRAGIGRLAELQRPDGSWTGDYSGPMFLLPLYVFTCSIVGRTLPAERRLRMTNALLDAQQPDGSLGLHEEAGGSLFASSIGYAALRMMGRGAEEPAVARLRTWIREAGTPLGAASWGKQLLALVDLYPYEALAPVMPELWRLPYALPLHPARLWCHARQVYLPLCWLWAQRARMRRTPLIDDLRRELYGRPWDTVPFDDFRHVALGRDDYRPLSGATRAVDALMRAYDRVHVPAWRSAALDTVLDHIRYEDQVTGDIDIGPVSSALHVIVHHFRDPGGDEERRGMAALDEYLFETERAIKMNGYNSTALWDTAFAIQALRAAGPSRRDPRAVVALERAHAFLGEQQIRTELPDHERHFRHASLGGWPFSDRRHGWPITDCTAEGLKAAIALQDGPGPALDPARLELAAQRILSLQNRDGGWATYERRRAGRWLEWLNPSQVFGEIMVDHSYVECTSACIQALMALEIHRAGPADRALRRAVARGVRYLRREQRPDGSWEGSWGVCFTYGTWFGVWALRAAGVPVGDRAIRRACGFLLAHQGLDGGWGEHGDGCRERRWIAAPSTPTNTAWSLLALMRGGCADGAAVRRGVAHLVQTQLPDGDWPDEPMRGVFNKTALIRYDTYRRTFPIWALALHLDR